MKNDQKVQGNWNEIKTEIMQRWNISENDLIQSSGIPELANLIAKKVGEPRPNVLHELIAVVRTIDPDHALLKEYFDKTMAQGDDGARIVKTEKFEKKAS
jgi:hypothetical protein